MQRINGRRLLFLLLLAVVINSATAAETLVETSFEKGQPRPLKPRKGNVKYSTEQSRTGATSLHLWKEEADGRSQANYFLDPPEMKKLRVFVWIKTRGVQGPARLGGIYFNVVMGGEEKRVNVNPIAKTIYGDTRWTKFDGRMRVPEWVDSLRLTALLQDGSSGHAWFDDLTVRAVRPSPRSDGGLDPADGLVYGTGRPKETPDVDGDLSEWKDGRPLVLDGDELVTSGSGAGKNGREPRARLWTAWTDAGFYLAAEVKGQNHVYPHSGAEVWRNDSLQLAFDTKGNEGETYNPVDDYEINCGPTPNGPEVHKQFYPSEISAGILSTTRGVELSVSENGVLYGYELFIPWAHLAPFTPPRGESSTWR